MPTHPNSSPIAGRIMSVWASGIVLPKPSPAPCPVMPPVEIAQMPLATWSPPYTWLFQGSDQMALRSTSLCIGPGITFAKIGTWSSNRNPLTTTSAIMDDSLNLFLPISINKHHRTDGNTGGSPHIFENPNAKRVQEHGGNHLYKISA